MFVEYDKRYLSLLLLFFFFFFFSPDCYLVESKDTFIWYAPFYSGGGYSSEAQSFALSIHQQLLLVPFNNNSITSSFNRPDFYINQHGDTPKSSYLKSLRKNERDLFLSIDFQLDNKEITLMHSYNKTSDYIVAICHSEPGAWDAPYPFYYTSSCPPSYADIRIGRTMFETDQLPEGWENRINTMHEVWVPTEFAKDIFIKAGVNKRKIVVVPEPVDTEFFQPRNLSDLSLSQVKNRNLRKVFETAMILPHRKFTFLFVGKWETRKQLKLLLRAFFKEFGGTSVTTTMSNVQLAVLTSQYHSTSDFKKEIIKEIKSNNDLHIYEPFVDESVIVLSSVPQKYMPFLYSAVDILVILVLVIIMIMYMYSCC